MMYNKQIEEIPSQSEFGWDSRIVNINGRWNETLNGASVCCIIHHKQAFSLAINNFTETP